MHPHLGGVPGCKLVYPVPLLKNPFFMHLHLWSPQSLPLWLVSLSWRQGLYLQPTVGGIGGQRRAGWSLFALNVLSAEQLTELVRWKAGGYRADVARALHTNHVNWIIATSWCLVLTQP